MRWFNNLRIVHKLGLLLLGALVLLGASLGVILWNSMRDVMRENIDSKGTNLASQLAVLSSEPIQMADLYALHELVHLTMVSDKEIRYVLIVDREGKLMAHTFSQGIPKKLLGAHGIPEQKSDAPDVVILPTDEGTIHDILFPIEQGALGYIRIGMDEKAINQILHTKIYQLMVTTFIVGVVVLLLVLKLANLLTKPLQRLTDISETIAAGQLPQAIPGSSSLADEIGILTAAINHMVENLKKNEVERQSLLNRLITVQEDERKRISRELHDETGQALTYLILSMRALAKQTNDAEQRSVILAARDEAVSILNKLRNLAVELSPPALDELGLVAAVQRYIDDFKGRYNIHVEVEYGLPLAPLEGRTSLALYRILQESLTNIIKHADARHAYVILREQGENIELIIKDDGVGLSRNTLVNARSENRLGLYGMQERVEILGGKLALTSEPPQWATVVKAIVPSMPMTSITMMGEVD